MADDRSVENPYIEMSVHWPEAEVAIRFGLAKYVMGDRDYVWIHHTLLGKLREHIKLDEQQLGEPRDVEMAFVVDWGVEEVCLAEHFDGLGSVCIIAVTVSVTPPTGGMVGVGIEWPGINKGGYPDFRSDCVDGQMAAHGNTTRDVWSMSERALLTKKSLVDVSDVKLKLDYCVLNGEPVGSTAITVTLDCRSL
jgi:hypothetical protein